MQIKFDKEVKIEELKLELQDIGKTLSTPETSTDTSTNATVETPENKPTITTGTELVNLSDAIIVSSSDGYIIKTKYISNEQHDSILVKLKEKFGNLNEIRFTTVGAMVGDTMKSKAALALFISLIAIVVYITFAFRKIPRSMNPWRFGVCAIIALAHDIFFVIGAYAIFGFLFKVEVDALFITALLTILGFSVHDTIVVFDRIRENLKYMNKETTLTDVANQALTQTVARSINTSMSTLLTLIALLIFGSSSLFWFVLALVLGITVGTYSSIFIASPLLVWWDKRSKRA
jgi:preprotein translocase subunit SecF